MPQFARGSYLQALLIFPRSSFLNFAKDSRQVDGMHSSCPGQVAHAKRFTESFVQVVFRAVKPARRSLFWTAGAMPKGNGCWSCREAHAAVEPTLVQSYATLKPVAKEFGTYNEAREQVADAK